LRTYYHFTSEQEQELSQIEAKKKPLYQQLASVRLVIDNISDVITNRKQFEQRLVEEERKSEAITTKLEKVKDLINEGRINTVKQMVKEGRI
jgi:hypothetical protein